MVIQLQQSISFIFTYNTEENKIVIRAIHRVIHKKGALILKVHVFILKPWHAKSNGI